jgi:hypothetical protein
MFLLYDSFSSSNTHNSSSPPSKTSSSRSFERQTITPPYSRKATASNKKATALEAFSSNTTLRRNLALS